MGASYEHSGNPDVISITTASISFSTRILSALDDLAFAD
jgi:hypothetical protein